MSIVKRIGINVFKNTVLLYLRIKYLIQNNNKMKSNYYKQVSIPVGNVLLKGELFVPENANGIIIFSHGSGSGRLSKRNQLVAKFLQEKNFGTLLFDLLTENEDQYFHNRFNITLLTERLIGSTTWLEMQPVATGISIGYFGASTGAASAINAAAVIKQVAAVVSRGGRPDLASDKLNELECPTLFIVGSLDYDVLKLNMDALSKLHCEKKLEIVEGATHLFEEKGTIEKVCEIAYSWFEKHLHPIEEMN